MASSIHTLRLEQQSRRMAMMAELQQRQQQLLVQQNQAHHVPAPTPRYSEVDENTEVSKPHSLSSILIMAEPSPASVIREKGRDGEWCGVSLPMASILRYIAYPHSCFSSVLQGGKRSADIGMTFAQKFVAKLKWKLS